MTSAIVIAEIGWFGQLSRYYFSSIIGQGAKVESTAGCKMHTTNVGKPNFSVMNVMN
jgi:hypothetical protein